MKIGVLSDTHLRDRDDSAPLENLIRTYFEDCAAIIHAGDLVSMTPFYAALPEDVPFFAVAGNMDPTDIGYPRRRIIEFGGKRIGLIHGDGGGGEVPRRALSSFADENVDAVIFGHSHTPYNRKIGSVLLFNPGSAFDRRYAPYRSIGILELGDTVTGTIIELEG